MIIPINAQVNLIIYSILAGVLTGILFDIYRLIRGFENPDVIITLVEDVLFWVFAGILVFIFLLCYSYVYMGTYLYLYIALGLYIYIKFISKYFLRIQFRLMKMLSKIFRIIKNLIIYPIDLLIYKIINKNK
ncbi:spore cortex biosynthesis protein YabQ [Clostridium ganghwense]|uniref:Spore cortex biosynthesis protein YabQ n=1 Tax=Clostridium ganghwense TaxID=312089 RepID=A0ABT4CSC0_9CLOT|nr:spore cortex biosynthesis protein YabQ [Clostridium ganghwense]MCY6371965.1 spore cortex biosynthesis protein YabQ [Clostridium ganghwense]